jgi:hypothetical protein
VLVQQNGKLVNANTWWYAGAAFLAALLATGLLHLLLLSAPQPYRFFGWIIGLLVAIAGLLPYTTSAELSSKVTTSVLNLAIGLSISSIVGGVGRSAARVPDERPPPPQYNERPPHPSTDGRPPRTPAVAIPQTTGYTSIAQTPVVHRREQRWSERTGEP